jgi:hypothetical protein
MQAVLKEVLRSDLRKVADSDNLDRDTLGQFGRPDFGLPANVLVLTQGWLSKQKYLVTVPDPSYLVERLSSKVFEEANADPIKFLHTHWRNASRSLMVEHCKQRLLRIESAAVDAQFRDITQHVTAHLAGETFAYALSTSVGTSPEVSIFIAACFGIAIDVMASLRKGKH